VGEEVVQPDESDEAQNEDPGKPDPEAVFPGHEQFQSLEGLPK
jgi:hypothetical protein